MATITLNPGDNIQTLGVNVANDGDVIHLNDGVYEQQALSIPATPVPGGTWATGLTIEGNGQYDGTNGALISGGKIVTSWTASGSNWFASSGVSISQQLGNSNENYGVYSRGAHRLTCTVDEQWYHHVGSTSELQDTPPIGAAGNFFYDYGLNRLWISTNPSGAEVIVSVNSLIVGGPGDNLTLQNLSVGHSRATTQAGAIGGTPSITHGDNWTIDNVEVYAVHGVGVQLKSDGNSLQNSYIHHCGQMGVGCSSTVNNSSGNDNNVDNSMTDTRIEYCNMNGYVPGWEAGATKLAWTDRFTATHNTVRFNKGFGLWWDINCFDIVANGNLIEDNWGPGLMQEIGFSTQFYDNKIVRSGKWPLSDRSSSWSAGTTGVWPRQPAGGAGWGSHPGIMIAESNGLFSRPNGNQAPYGILVHDNWVEDNDGGIFLRQINRDGDSSFPGGDAYKCKGIKVYENDVWWDTSWADGKHGGGQNGIFPQMFSQTGTAKNDFYDNEYTINGTRSIPVSGWEWDNGARNYSSWRNTYGFDTTNAGITAAQQNYGVRTTSSGQNVTTPFLNGLGTIFAPSVGLGSGQIFPPLLTQSVLYDPTVRLIANPANGAAARINAGGPTITGNPDWEADTIAAPHQYNDDNIGTNTISNWTGAIDYSDPEIATHPDLPVELFHTERYDPDPSSMSYTIRDLDPTKTYKVRVFAAENFSGITGPGQRVFDVFANGVAFKEDWDLWEGGSAPTVVPGIDVVGWKTPTSGGAGGTVYTVTNLNDSGTGSFREAMTATGPRIIEFAVAGNINLNGEISLTSAHSNLTVRGETAPYPGICVKLANNTITDGALEIDGADDLIFQWFRIRPNGQFDSNSGAVIHKRGSRHVWNHMTFSWGNDEVWDQYLWEGGDVVVQYCMVYEGLKKAGGAGRNFLVGMPDSGRGQPGGMTIHHTLFANTKSRSPQIRQDITGMYEVSNNVFYNCVHTGNSGSDTETIFANDDPSSSRPVRGNWRGNTVIFGPAGGSSPNTYSVRCRDLSSAGAQIYVGDQNNTPVYNPGDTDHGPIFSPDSRQWEVSTPHASQDPAFTVEPAANAYQKVLDFAGASYRYDSTLGVWRYSRDAADERVVGDVQNGTGDYIQDPLTETPGYPFGVGNDPPEPPPPSGGGSGGTGGSHVAKVASVVVFPDASGNITITTQNNIQSALFNAIEISPTDWTITVALLSGVSTLHAPEVQVAPSGSNQTVTVPFLDNAVGSPFNEGFNPGFGNGTPAGAAQIFEPTVAVGGGPGNAPQQVTLVSTLSKSQLFKPTVSQESTPVTTSSTLISPIWFDVLDPSDFDTDSSSRSVNRNSSFDIGQNDTAPSLVGQVRNGSNNYLDLSSGGVDVASAVFSMRKATDGAVVIDEQAATIDPDQTNNPGKITYTWATSDTAEAGEYEAEFELTLTDGRKLTVPNTSPKIRIIITGEIS